MRRLLFLLLRRMRRFHSSARAAVHLLVRPLPLDAQRRVLNVAHQQLGLVRLLAVGDHKLGRRLSSDIFARFSRSLRHLCQHFRQDSGLVLIQIDELGLV